MNQGMNRSLSTAMLSTAAIRVTDEDKKEEAGRSDIIRQASMVHSMAELVDERVDGCAQYAHPSHAHLSESRNDWDSCQDAGVVGPHEKARGCRSTLLSARCSSRSKKYTEPPCKIEDIPDTDAVIISVRSSLSNSAMAYAVVSVIILTSNDTHLESIGISKGHAHPSRIGRTMRKHRGFDLAMIPIWTWILKMEEITEPPKRLVEECRKIGISDRDFLVRDIGEKKYF
ncbi:hypothetical protein ARMSODRAFT_975822 [Armillaria solidipes]|uniref:Uncharacterized protein n=1 Tax=Armillaria solidipes TaxID=1076256 RepID=A0A2H3BV22_9AGAR|nr:hypothetical protein ARMSODRAFT_975822 [Armillaria solidipes]